MPASGPTGRRAPARPPRDRRALGVDLGSKRIGLAVSDSAGRLATPYDVLARSGDEARDHAAIVGVAAEVEACTIVVGLPLSLDGGTGPAAQGVLDEVARLAKVAAVPVETFDERLTTVTAERDLMAQRMRAQARRRVVDKVAAAVLLQSWLDALPAGEGGAAGDRGPTGPP
ncbi:MAG: Holliday junction resolvase RuvX [Acidimicrobiia bacterium]|nr:Holliday junction resolvase RuvX [Acidimicrobiia bacterium]